jgi:hypothetical protein
LRTLQDIQDEQALVAINIAIGQAEKWAVQPWAITFLDYILAEDFRFRRVTGEEVIKKDYLEALTSGARTYEYLNSDDVKVDLLGERATVTLRVTTKGYNDNRLIEGQFRNTRAFEKRQGRWQLVTWQNTPMAQP